MKEILVKAGKAAAHILFLAAVFIVSTLLFSGMINQIAPDEALSMGETTFPLVYMRRNGVSFNCLWGYAQEMDHAGLRDTITPLQSDRSLDIQIQTYDTTIDSVSYEVLTLDGEESLENTKVIKLEPENDVVNATLHLQNRMLMNQEYLLKLKLTCAGRNIWYYTHVVLADGLHTDDYLSSVNGFYDKTINKTDLDWIGEVVEPDETTDEEGTLAFMDIHDSVQQLTWDGLNPQLFYKPVPAIREINTNTATLTTEYRIASVNERGHTEIFNVREYYRVRFTDSRVFVLNFERTTDEVFDPENNVLGTKGIRLGITGKDVEYASDNKNKVVAFVQQNELWTYENATAKLTQVFSFPQKQNMDYRDFHDASNIRILKVDGRGNVWFTVAGYMNRGAHEGGNGVILYYYEAATDMVDEKVFLSCERPWDQLERDVDTLSYVTDDGSRFFLLMDERLYRVRLSDRNVEIVAEGIHEHCFSTSASGRYLAWLEEGEQYHSTKIHLMDMENGNDVLVEANEGEYIAPVCFMNDDLVYGMATESDLAAGTLRDGLFPMYALRIVDRDGNERKTYQPGGNVRITGVSVSENMIALTRKSIRNDGKGLLPASDDQIVVTDSPASTATGTATDQSQRKQTEIYLRTGDEITAANPEIVRSKVIRYETARMVRMEANPQPEQLYLVYAGGKLLDRFAQAREAIALADEKLGVVVDTAHRYVWVRGNRTVNAQLPIEDLPQAVRDGSMDMEVLAAQTEKTVLDLTGLTQDQILYFISHGQPVMAVMDKGNVAVTGYDEFNTHLLDPGGSEWYYFASDDSNAIFEQQGNRFISFVP